MRFWVDRSARSDDKLRWITCERKYGVRINSVALILVTEIRDILLLY